MSAGGRENPAQRIVIIGGGLAGLSAAESLLQTSAHRCGSLSVTLLESRRTTGGRAGSFVDNATGQSIDYCQHVTMGCCTQLLAMLDRLGLQKHWQRYSELSFYHPEHGWMPFRAADVLPPPLHLDAALRGLRFLSWRQKVNIRWALWRLMRTPTERLGKVTAADWLRSNHQHAPERELFWDVILVSALGDVTERVSMAAARKVMIDGFAGARGASDVWVPRLPLSELFGEMTSQRLVDQGLQLRCNVSVRSLGRETQRSSLSPQWTIGVGQGVTQFEADHVILATAWQGAARLLRQVDESLLPRCLEIESLQGSPITGIHLWLDRRLTTRPHGVFVGTLTQWLFCQPLDVAGTAEAGVYHQVVISGEHRLGGEGKDVLVAAVMAELRAAFPDAADAELLRYRVVTDPQSVFSVSPESITQRPPTSIGVSGLSLAGDWVQTGWPATMEGAVISGRLAAIAACEEWDLEPPVPPASPLRRGWLARGLIRC